MNQLEDLVKTIEGLTIIGEEILPKIDEAVRKVSPTLRNMYLDLAKFSREQNVEAFEYYIIKGFTREEALLLIIDSSAALEKAINNITKQNK